MCEGMEMYMNATNLCWTLYYGITIELRLIFNVMVIIAIGYIVSQILFQSIQSLEKKMYTIKHVMLRFAKGLCKHPEQFFPVLV